MSNLSFVMKNNALSFVFCAFLWIFPLLAMDPNDDGGKSSATLSSICSICNENIALATKASAQHSENLKFPRWTVTVLVPPNVLSHRSPIVQVTPQHVRPW